MDKCGDNKQVYATILYVLYRTAVLTVATYVLSMTSLHMAILVPLLRSSHFCNTFISKYFLL